MRNSIRLLTVGTALTTAISLSGCDREAQGLTPEQASSVDHAFRIGRMGLEAYKDALSSSTETTAQDDFLTSKNSNISGFGGHAIVLGKSLKTGEDIYGSVGGKSGAALDETTVTPSHDKTSSTVVYKNSSSNMTYKNKESVTFSNPDPDFFKDNTASPKEMVAFYKDPKTVVTAAAYHNKDALDGVVDFEATRKNGQLNVQLREADTFDNETTPHSYKLNPVGVIRTDILYEY